MLATSDLPGEEKERIREIAYITTLDKFKNNLFRMNQTVRICESLNNFLTGIFKVDHSSIYLWSDEEGAKSTNSNSISIINL